MTNSEFDEFDGIPISSLASRGWKVKEQRAAGEKSCPVCHFWVTFTAPSHPSGKGLSTSWNSLGKSGDVMVAFALDDDVERVFILWVWGVFSVW
jgi:hypothetical protein